jgi:hypothetical protein
VVLLLQLQLVKRMLPPVDNQVHVIKLPFWLMRLDCFPYWSKATRCPRCRGSNQSAPSTARLHRRPQQRPLQGRPRGNWLMMGGGRCQLMSCARPICCSCLPTTVPAVHVSINEVRDCEGPC